LLPPSPDRVVTGVVDPQRVLLSWTPTTRGQAGGSSRTGAGGDGGDGGVNDPVRFSGVVGVVGAGVGVGGGGGDVGGDGGVQAVLAPRATGSSNLGALVVVDINKTTTTGGTAGGVGLPQRLLVKLNVTVDPDPRSQLPVPAEVGAVVVAVGDVAKQYVRPNARTAAPTPPSFVLVLGPWPPPPFCSCDVPVILRTQAFAVVQVDDDDTVTQFGWWTTRLIF
jgi:hypothetical protein